MIKNKTIKIGSAKELQVEFSQYGAAVTSINIASEKLSNVVLGLNDPSQVVSGGSYAGAVIGALAGRVPNSVVYIDDKEYTLEPNDGRHFLHGGKQGIANKLWDISSIEKNAATFLIKLRHLEDGLPGNRIFKATYMVDGKKMRFQIEVSSDAVSPVNITNHMYFNLSGNFENLALDHELLINAQKVILNDNEHIPKEIIDVKETAFDFNKPQTILHNLNLNSSFSQIKFGKGYNNCFMLEDGAVACQLTHRPSGRGLIITTSYPSLVFYSGGFLDSKVILQEGYHAVASCALALEPQFKPGVQRFYSGGRDVVTPMKKFKQFINYEFSC